MKQSRRFEFLHSMFPGKISLVQQPKGLKFRCNIYVRDGLLKLRSRQSLLQVSDFRKEHQKPLTCFYFRFETQNNAEINIRTSGATKIRKKKKNSKREQIVNDVTKRTSSFSYLIYHQVHFLLPSFVVRFFTFPLDVIQSCVVIERLPCFSTSLRAIHQAPKHFNKKIKCIQAITVELTFA